MAEPAKPVYLGYLKPRDPCREMPTRHCPAVYGEPCGERPCARYHSDDEAPWLAEIACPMCGQALAGHDQAACDEKMCNWQPTGFLNQSPPLALGDLQRAYETIRDAPYRPEMTILLPSQWDALTVAEAERILRDES